MSTTNQKASLYAIDMTGVRRRKSPLSHGGNDCVEIAQEPDGTLVSVTDSKRPEMQGLRFLKVAWATFEEHIRNMPSVDKPEAVEGDKTALYALDLTGQPCYVVLSPGGTDAVGVVILPEGAVALFDPILALTEDRNAFDPAMTARPVLRYDRSEWWAFEEGVRQGLI